MANESEEKEPATSTEARKGRRRWPKGGPTKAELRRYRDLLVALQRRILKSSARLADEALKGSGQDFSVDHMADHGTDNFEQDFSLALLEGETELFRDVQAAIDRIDGRTELPYGLCEACADDPPPVGSPHRCPTCPWIAKGRLDAVPYARLCVLQQELEEQGGA